MIRKLSAPILFTFIIISMLVSCSSLSSSGSSSGGNSSSSGGRESYTNSDNVVYTNTGTTWIVLTGTNASGNITILSNIDGVPVTEIGDNAFDGSYCAITTVTIPSSITNIARWYFKDCGILANFFVDSANQYYESIDGVLFDKTGTILLSFPRGKAGNYSIPSGVTNINLWALGGTCLSNITIPSSVTSIGLGAFNGCSYVFSPVLTNISVDSANLYYESIAGVLFDKTGTILLSFPGGIAGSYTIPSGVTNIGGDTFSGITLNSVIIPSSVNSIGSSIAGSFFNCSSLTSITVQGTTPPDLPTGSQAFINCNSSLQIHVPSGSLSAYKAATGWSNYVSIIVTP